MYFDEAPKDYSSQSIQNFKYWRLPIHARNVLYNMISSGRIGPFQCSIFMQNKRIMNYLVFCLHISVCRLYETIVQFPLQTYQECLPGCGSVFVFCVHILIDFGDTFSSCLSSHMPTRIKRNDLCHWLSWTRQILLIPLLWKSKC